MPLWEEDEQLDEGLHTVCIDCRGVDCDLNHCCVECNDTDDSTMTEYVRHKLTLQRKITFKHKELKLVDISDVVDDPAPDKAVCSDASLLVEPLLPVNSPSVSDLDIDFVLMRNSRLCRLISDTCRGRYMVYPTFIFFFFFFFFPPRFCTDHISGTVTHRDSKLSVLLGPAV